MLLKEYARRSHRFHAACKLVASASIALLVAACSAGTTTEPPEISTSAATTAAVLTPLTQPPQYALWWAMTRSCSGLDRDVSGVRFSTVPSGKLQTPDAGSASIAGNWNATTNSITLSLDAVTSPTVVRHEMLHALIVTSGHPAEMFARDCAAFVNCEGVCATEAEQEPRGAIGVRVIESADLVVTQRLVPSEIDLTADPEGWFALIVEVRNPTDHAVQARLRPFPGRSNVSATLGYAGARASHQEYVEGSLLPLQPGEVRRAVFDLRARDFLAENGSNRIRGFFNADSLPALNLTFAGR